MKLLLSHPVGSSFVRQAARAFEDAGLLSEFWTSIARSPESVWDTFLPAKVRGELRRRSYDRDILAKTRSHFSREAVRIFALRMGKTNLTEHETGRFSYDSVAQHLDRRVAKRLSRGGIDAVYAYEDSALETFRAAKANGIRTVYELPIGHWRLARRIFAEEAELHPEWASTLEGLRDSDAKLDRKDEEARLAGRIVVPSKFVADSLEECPDVTAEVRIVNYGAPDPVSEIRPREKGPLRIIFVGSLGARKGVQYLLEAVKGLDVELTLIGPKPNNPCAALDEQLSAHRYLGSVPRARVLEEMATHDVFVFPTLFEGLANVMMEALSRGLVVVTTPNSGAVGVVEDGVDGFIVPMRSASAVAEKLEFLGADPDRLMEMRHSALLKAANRSWAKYRSELVSAVGLSLAGVP